MSSLPKRLDKRRVWVVSELYYPELTSTGYFLTGLAEGLAETYDVAVLCGQPSYWSRGVRAPGREIRNGVAIHRCPASTLDKNRAAFKIINLITISLSTFYWALVEFRRGDIVVMVTNPPLLPYLVSIAIRLKGARSILLVHDVYPEILVRLGMLKPRSIFFRALDRVSRWLYHSTDRVVVIGRDMQRLIAQKMPSRNSSVSVAPNWANTDDISPTSRSENSLLASLGLTDRFVVQIWGNIGRPHCVEDLIAAADILKHDPQIHFLVIGWGTRKSWVVAEKDARKLDNITIIDPLPRGETCKVQNACDVVLNTLSSGMSGISVPSRTYNALAAGKPLVVVCDEDSEIAIVVKEENIGWVIPPGHPDQLASALREAHGDRELLRRMGERARQAVENKYTRNHILESYKILIEGLRSSS
ncbi:MAG TPA: glycosyltransferase family 4 protein [Terracidiphilus sp.]|nr:glycosyltransferase family 4 protein [Terracidiphilus sp.]